MYDGNWNGLCAGNTVAIPTHVQIFGCIERNSGANGCYLETDVDSTWGDVYYGADNCLYGASCEYPTSPSFRVHPFSLPGITDCANDLRAPTC